MGNLFPTSRWPLDLSSFLAFLWGLGAPGNLGRCYARAAKCLHSTPRHTAEEYTRITCNFGRAPFSHWGVFPSVQRGTQTRNKRQERAEREEDRKKSAVQCFAFFGRVGGQEQNTLGWTFMAASGRGRAPMVARRRQVGLIIFFFGRAIGNVVYATSGAYGANRGKQKLTKKRPQQ